MSRVPKPKFEMGELAGCPVCGRAKPFWKQLLVCHAPYYEKKVTGIEYVPYWICQCGMMFQPIVIKDQEAYYRKIYRTTLEGSTDEVVEHGAEKDRAHRLIEVCLEVVPEINRALDVGSASGYFLNKLHSVYDCIIQGVEIADNYREHANAHDIPTVESMNKVEGTFDFLSIIHTLEHQLNPVQMLRAMMDHATSNSTFLIEVPFFNFRLNHPLLFSYSNLEMILNVVGLEVIRVAPGIEELTMFAKKRKLV